MKFLLLALALQQPPSDAEQLLIYELNRARNNPPRYAAENGLGTLLDSVAPKPPLAVNAYLVASASFHAEEMADNNYFGHQSAVDGRWPNEMAIDEGYALPYPPDENNIESLAAGFSDVQAALRGLIEDVGVDPPGHREHLLATGSGEWFWNTHREIGTGFAMNPSSTYGRYYAIHTARVNASDLFLTGVVYDDANGNLQYDLGEGLGGVTVSDGTNTTLTNPAGGWSLPTVNGTYTIMAWGGAFSGWVGADVTVSNANVEVDFRSGASSGEVNFADQGGTPPPGGGGSSGDDGDSDRCGLLGMEVILMIGAMQLLRRRGLHV